MSKKRRHDYLECLGLVRLVRLAACDDVGKDLAGAALVWAALKRLEVGVEHRFTNAHNNLGCASSSPLAFAGEGGRGGAPGQSEAVLLAAMNHGGVSVWRDLSKRLLNSLDGSSWWAVLARAYVVTPINAAQRSPRMISQAEVCEPGRSL